MPATGASRTRAPGPHAPYGPGPGRLATSRCPGAVPVRWRPACRLRHALATELPGEGTVRGASPHPPATGLRRTIPACGASSHLDAGPARHRPGPAAPHLTPMPGLHDTAPTPGASPHPGAPVPRCPGAPVPGLRGGGPAPGPPPRPHYGAARRGSVPAGPPPSRCRAASVPVPGRLRPGPGAGAGPDAVAGGKPRRSVREDRARGAIPRGRRPGCRPPSPRRAAPGIRPVGANLDMPAHTDRVIVGMSAARPGYPAPARRPSEGTDDDDEWFRRPGG
ncbi:hypothetical protein LRR80_00434 [Streptomyces sp. RO-S4]|nr:hypothetical protein [Streptomyces sp. RO-S4]